MDLVADMLGYARPRRHRRRDACRLPTLTEESLAIAHLAVWGLWPPNTCQPPLAGNKDAGREVVSAESDVITSRPAHQP